MYHKVKYDTLLSVKAEGADKDIAEGTHESEDCPISRALRRVLGDEVVVLTTYWAAAIDYPLRLS